ncbi:hypothetical protein V3C99_005472, partial [Haemonchus contortus]
ACATYTTTMPYHSPQTSKTSRSSSADKLDSNQPSSSYYVPQPTSHYNVLPPQQAFFKPSTYGQISYEIDDSSTSFHYSYNPRRVMDSNNKPTSKYLEDSPLHGQSNLDASENLFLNAPASVPSNFSYSSEVQEPEPVLSIQSPFHDTVFEPESLLNIPLPPEEASLETESVITSQSPFIEAQFEPEPLLNIPLPPEEGSIEPEPLLNIPLSPDDDELESRSSVYSPSSSSQAQIEPEPLLNIPLSQDDEELESRSSVSSPISSSHAQSDPEPLLNIPLSHDGAQAELSLSMDTGSPTGETQSDSKSVRNTQSPPDDARFSTPECAPDSVYAQSAPMSIDDRYVRSPSENSDGSNVTLREGCSIVGQPAEKASRKGVEKLRYESPKNPDDSGAIKAFYSGSEEYNSPDNFRLKEPNNEEVVQLEPEETDGRASMVDRLFAMLQRAEQDSGDEVTPMEARSSRTLIKESSKPPHAPILPQGLQPQFQPQVSQYFGASHFVSAPNPVQNISQYSGHPVSLAYTENAYRPSQVVGPSYPQTVFPSTSSQYLLQQVPLEITIGQPAQVPMRPAPDPPMFYNAPLPISQGPPLRLLPQFLPPRQTSTMNTFPTAVSMALQQPYQSSQGSWAMNLCETRPNIGGFEQGPQNFGEFRPLASSVRENEESSISDSSISLEKSFGSSASSSGTEYETSIDLESASVIRISPPKTVEEPRQKGPPFEQKGPTRTKEIGPVPPVPPPSPEVVRSNIYDISEPLSIAEQLERETERLEDISIREVANYDRQMEVEELRKRMCERFQRIYPNLFSKEINDEDVPGRRTDDEEGDFDDGDPKDGQVIRNGIQLTTRYLALWFPDKKEREEMIPWNIMRKVKPIRLCFLDNRIGHGEYEEFNMGEFVNITGHMMFTYGDGPEALDESRLYVLDIVRQQMNMLLRRVWNTMMQNHQRNVFTYVNIFGLYKNHPIRLRRLIRYLVEQNRKRHMLYRVMVDQGRRRGQNYFENRMDVNECGSTEVLCLRKRAPHIYYALIEAGFQDKLEFLCEERNIKDCDPALARIKMFLKRRNRHLSAEHKELLEYARRVSYCSRTGRLSAFRAHRFHEFLGFPDLQTDLIYILDFMAREIVMEVTYRASRAREQEREKLRLAPDFKMHLISREKEAAENLDIWYYEEGLRSSAGWRNNQDILFGEEEQPVTLSYGKNPWKWESDKDYNKREMAERRESEKEGPWPSRFAYVSSAELFEEHKKVLKGEYWDSCPEDLTKKAIAFANTYAAARELNIKLPEPQVPAKWKQQNEESNKKEQERLKKLLETNRFDDLQKRLTDQLVEMMAENNIEDTTPAMETDASTSIERMTKLISAAVRKHQQIGLAQSGGDL